MPGTVPGVVPAVWWDEAETNRHTREKMAPIWSFGLANGSWKSVQGKNIMKLEKAQPRQLSLPHTTATPRRLKQICFSI